MKSIDRNQLLDKLENETRDIVLRTNYLLQEDPEYLLLQPAPGKWSVAQVIEHLNSYGRYYLPLLEKEIARLPPAKNEIYKPGMLGNYFTNSMLPKEGVVKNHMKTFKDHRPLPGIDSKKVLEDFLQQEQWMLRLMHDSRKKAIAKNRIPVSIARFIKMKVGDTFRFMIAHHQRHFIQIENTLSAVKKS